jgi:hypothetical protein
MYRRKLRPDATEQTGMLAGSEYAVVELFPKAEQV